MSFSRLVLFEPRGSGLSDPLGRDERPSLEGQAEDLLAVLALQEQVHLAESPNLADMKQLAQLICRNALPEICWVKVEDGDGETGVLLDGDTVDSR